ncbi:hypothetical protein [Actinoplanes sp. NPDC051859]|uniref:hypothetical protein n=1 Tax=Actinoplanes sp. NPDC051859 TaxID=3363909 RepID=UPI0037A95099
MGALADPAVSVVDVHLRKCRHRHTGCSCATSAPLRRTVVFAPLTHPDLMLPPELLGRPPEGAYTRAYQSARSSWSTSWPFAFPSHRELLAAYLQPMLAQSADGNAHCGAALLPALARASGPVGPAFALCLAYGLTAGRSSERLAATDAFVLIGQSGVPGSAEVGARVGRELAALHAGGVLVLRRVAASLAGALQAGAAAQVWAAARMLVPGALTASAGGPDLLALATAAASAIEARDRLPELDAAVARGGRTRIATEAARLARTLGASG